MVSFLFPVKRGTFFETPGIYILVVTNRMVNPIFVGATLHPIHFLRTLPEKDYGLETFLLLLLPITQPLMKFHLRTLC